MSKILIYGSRLCPDTIEALDALAGAGADYTYLDINEDLSSLKAFLKFRDTRSEYDDVRKNGGIGIPLFVLDDGARITFDYQDLIK